MPYTVVAPCVISKDQEGRQHHSYEGDKISWLSAEQAKYFLDEKLVVKDGAAAEPEADESEDDGAPAKAATKSEWVDFAVAKGYDRDEVEALSKADIQALDFG
jgi:predicted Ser/Thr protein kinase